MPETREVGAAVGQARRRRVPVQTAVGVPGQTLSWILEPLAGDDSRRRHYCGHDTPDHGTPHIPSVEAPRQPHITLSRRQSLTEHRGTGLGRMTWPFDYSCCCSRCCRPSRRHKPRRRLTSIPVTLSRLPPVTPDNLDEAGRKLLSERPAAKPGPGPTHVTSYSPRERSLGIPTGVDSPVGPRSFQLAVLIIAREIDQQYEWSAHEPAGLRQGLEQSVIDVVKHNRDVKGLADKDATLITFGRTLYREHRVSSELWQKMIGHLGEAPRCS